jgi:hypothetical protein
LPVARTAPRPTRAAPERPTTVRIAERHEDAPKEAEAPPLPTAPPRESARAHLVPTGAVPEPPRPTAVASEAPRKPVSDEDRIREVIREYVAAQSSLDVDRYLRVRPALSGQRDQIERSFAGLKSQEVRFDVHSIELRGDQAEVRGHESRVFSPRVGGDQRSEGARTILLERRGAGWVISAIQ